MFIVQETSGTTALHDLSPTEVSDASNPSSVEPAEARVEMSPPREELSRLSPAEPAVSPATTPPCFDTAEETGLPPESGGSVRACLMAASSCYLSLLFFLHFINFFPETRTIIQERKRLRKLSLKLLDFTIEEVVSGSGNKRVCR